MNIDGKWLTETEATAYVRELKQRISTLEDLNDRLMKENGKLEKQLEVVHTAKGIDDMQIAHYKNDWKNTVGAIAVSEIERLRTENKKANDLLRESLPVLHRAFFANYKDTNAANELYDKIKAAVGGAENDT